MWRELNARFVHQIKYIIAIGRIRLSVSTINHTYELSGITHVTPFRKYRKRLIGPSTYEAWVRTYSKLFFCKSVLTVCSYRAQSNLICTYRRVSRGSLPRVRRYGLLYLRTVEYDQIERAYLDRFMVLNVSQSPSSAHTYLPRSHHCPDCFTVSTLCMYTGLGSRGYFCIWRCSCCKSLMGQYERDVTFIHKL